MGEFETKRCRGSEGHVLPGFCPETNPWKEVALQFAELVIFFWGFAATGKPGGKACCRNTKACCCPLTGDIFTWLPRYSRHLGPPCAPYVGLMRCMHELPACL